MKRFLRILTLLPAAILLWIIFCFSGQDATTSGSLSAEISAALVRFFDRLFHLALTSDELLAKTDSIHLLVRKAAHMTEFALLAFSVYLPIASFLPSKGFSFLRRLSLCFFLCFLFAAFDELHQTTVPGRSGNSLDVMIDALGSLLACALLLLVHTLRTRKRPVTHTADEAA